MAMNMKEAMEKALKEGNAVMAGKISDTLRFKYGWTYQDQVEAVKELGYTEQFWEELMYAAEWQEGH